MEKELGWCYGKKLKINIFKKKKKGSSNLWSGFLYDIQALKKIIFIFEYPESE